MIFHTLTHQPLISENPDTEKQLLSRIAAGDEGAFRALFDKYQSRLYQYLFNTVKSKEVAEELVMDVFLKLWLARERITDIENMDGFLFRVAYNKSIDFFRATAKNKQLTHLLWDAMEVTSGESADTHLLSQEYDAKLREALNLLAPQRKKIFSLSREQGFSHAQIAEQLGISKNTVANTIVDARQFILNHLAKHFDAAVFMALLANFSD